MARRLGTILVDMGYLNDDALWKVLEEQKRSDNELIGKVAVRLGLVTEDQVLKALGEQFADPAVARRRKGQEAMPIAGTRLIREYQGVEETVTVLRDGYEWRGQPYRSLSAIARAITGTRWNGLVFFGLKSRRSS